MRVALVVPGGLDRSGRTRVVPSLLWLVERLAGSGLLLLDALRFDGRVVAAIYGFRAHGTSSYYLGGFDPSLRKLSPGVALIGWTIEQELRAGAVAFDFLRGGESYKYAWGASDRPTFRRLLLRTSTQRNSQAALTEGSEGVRSR